MTKNLTTINQFIDKSIGEWKSIRSTHTLAFQEFENSTSKIYIKHINKKNKKVVEIFKNNDEIQKHLNLHNEINNGLTQKMALIIDKNGNWEIQNNKNYE